MRPDQLTPPQLAELIEAFQDHERFCRESLRIRDLAGSRVPLICSPGQLALHEAITVQRRQNRPIRLVVLKTRRSWFTSGVCAEMFKEIPFFPGRKGLIIADKFKPAALEAFGYLLQFQRGYRPFKLHGGIRLPKLIKDTEQQLQWANDSAIDVLSAEGGDVGRGGGRHFVLGDEVAFWRAAELTLTSVLNMVPKLAGTMVVLQSTANGVGGEFYDICQKAMDPANEDGFVFLFFGWLQHPPYRMRIEGDRMAFQRSLDAEELALHEMHGATLEQLRWRRATIATECRGKLDLFHQEYPTTPDEAFLSSGRPALTLTTLVRMPAWESPLVGEMREIEEFSRVRLQFVPSEHGALVIGKRPEAGRSYVIGADPSKGVDVSDAKRGADPDWSVAPVLDLDNGEQVAQFRARERPVAFAQSLARLGRLYNYAYLVPESNDPGFIDALLRTGYPIESIYNRRRDPTDRRSIQPQEIGFYTDASTRPWLISALDDALREVAIIVRSPIAQQECRTFVIKPNGKSEHQAGCHDDCVLALALGCMGLRFAPRKLRRTAVGAARAGGTSYGKKPAAEEKHW